MSAPLCLRSVLFVVVVTGSAAVVRGDDYLRQLQTTAIEQGKAEVAHWGHDPEKYTMWGSHTNRLIPVYTFGTLGAGAGVDLNSYLGENSLYRKAESVEQLYGFRPKNTVNPAAEYMDQTDICRLQRAAAAAGKKHVFLVVFDGMDWQTTRAAATYYSRRVAYDHGRGTGLHFLDYRAGGTTQFGYMVTSPHNEGTSVDVNLQRVLSFSDVLHGGYDVDRAGPNPWTPPADPPYLISLPKDALIRHAYTDSSSSASSMTAGIKTYNHALNVDPLGRPVTTIAHELQERGWATGVVTSVPISHATPAAAYAQNVHRDDYQDLTRDLIGLSSISHPQTALPGLDVVLGCGYGVTAKMDKDQGENYVPGNKYLTDDDLRISDVRHGGRYAVTVRTPGVSGSESLRSAASQAAKGGQRLLGFFGTSAGNLPFRTADGDYEPAPGRSKKAIQYEPADIHENPTLAEMTAAAISVVEQNPQGSWLLVEAGDVDYANHDNNLDNSIGAVKSGDDAIRVITDWVERSSNWQESLLIVTADHGHYLVLDRPELLIPPAAEPGSKQP